MPLGSAGGFSQSSMTLEWRTRLWCSTGVLAQVRSVGSTRVDTQRRPTVRTFVPGRRSADLLERPRR